MNNFETLMKELTESEELRKEFETAIESLREENKDLTEQEAFVAAAKEKGYDISLEELAKSVVESQELSMDDLEQVSGAGWCWSHFSCAFFECNQFYEAHEGCGR